MEKAMWTDWVEYWRFRRDQTNMLVDSILLLHRKEGRNVSALDDFRRDYLKTHVHEMPLAERLAGLSVEERLTGVPPEEIRHYRDGLKLGLTGPKKARRAKGTRRAPPEARAIKPAGP